MTSEKTNANSRVFQGSVTTIGIGAWLAAAISLPVNYTPRECLVFLLLVPLAVVIGRFIHTFPLPSGLRFTKERISFSLADAFVLLIACWFGAAPAIFIAGVEGFTSARRTSKRLSSNLFSSSMMSLGATAAALALGMVLGYGFGEAGAGGSHSLLAVSVAILVASLVQFSINIALLSTLLALRHNNPLTQQLNDFLWTVAVFLPTSAAASAMYFALQHGVLIMIVIGAPVIIAIYLNHRNQRNSVQKRVEAMEKAHRETIEALAVTINAKDEVTHEHVMRVQIYAAGVARLLGCSTTEIEALKAGALLHDIGKIAVPDHILNKPGKLTAEEFEKMKLHTLVGAQILGRVELPYPVVPIVRSHHERWDGKGYPDGLKGDEIPLTARIISVVDCFDAVREDRQYRRALSRNEAIDLLMQGSGTQYDPRVVGMFVTHLPQFEAEINAHRGAPVPNFGIEPVEQLSAAARAVAPAAGLDETAPAAVPTLHGGAPVKPKLKHDELLALYKLAQELNAARDREEIARAFIANLKMIVPFDTCALTLLAPDTATYRVMQTAGEHAALLENRSIAVGEGITGWVIANCKAFCNNDPKLDLPPALGETFAAYRTLAAFPIIKGEELHGAITLYSSALDKYTADHQHLMMETAALAAAAFSSLSEPTTVRVTNDDALPRKWAVFETTSKDSGDWQSELAH